MNDDNISTIAANWWANKIRETTPSTESKIGVFKKYLSVLIHDNYSKNGSVTISIRNDVPNRILIEALLNAKLFSNKYIWQCRYEMKITPSLISVYDQYGCLQECRSV